MRTVKLFKGFLDRATKKDVFGWASKGPDDDSSVRVILNVDGQDVAEMTADMARPAVAEKGLHATGRCGFRFKAEHIPAALRRGRRQIRAYALLDNGARIELQRSPQDIVWPSPASENGEIATDPTRRPAAIIRPPNHAQPKTLIVMGVSRGGTSLAAGVLRLAGVFMGHKVAHDSHEDAEFHNHDPGALKNLILARNTEQSTWGWKYPHAVDYLSHIHAHLRNPHFIVVFRDLLSVAQGFNRKHDIPIHEALLDAHQRYGKIARFVSECRDPLMSISYEKAITQQGLFLDDMENFCGFELDAKTRRRCLAFIKPGDYVSLSAKKIA